MWCGAGLLVRCMQHVQEDADWRAAVAAGGVDMRHWQPRLTAIMKLLKESPVLPAAEVTKLNCWLQRLLVCLHP